MSSLRTLMTDTLRGLVQRRLWPVAVLLLAAMVTLPVVLKAEAEPAEGPAPDASVRAEQAALASTPIVAAASAEDREARRDVIGGRKDPFKPHAGAKKDEGAGSGAQASSPEASSATSVSSDPDPGPGSGRVPSGGVTPGGSPIVPGAAPRTDTTHPTYSLTVRWGASEDEELTESVLKRLRALPSADEPVVIYLGLTDGGRKAVFMVDEAATPIGDGKCRPDPANCQTLELAAGETEFFDVDLGDGEVAQFQLDVVKIHRKEVSSAKAAAKARAARAPKARRALAAISAEPSEYRFDAGTGLLARRKR